jgi:hypothetical protein
MSPSNPTAVATEFHPYGLPMGTVRGFLSVLICSFFWIVLLYPDDQTLHVPLAHFFLLSLVFMAFASHPLHDAQTSSFLPWIMRVIFVGGSAAVLGFAGYYNLDRMAVRLTPPASDVNQWPALLGCFSGGFGIALFVRFVMGRRNEVFQTARAWLGVLAILLLILETLLQFIILPSMDPTNRPGPETLKIWEGTLVAAVAAYFGCRA